MADNPAQVEHYHHIIRNANYADLEDFDRMTEDEHWEYIHFETTRTINQYYSLCRNSYSCYQVAYGVLVCTQYKLRRIVSRFCPSLIVLCQQPGDFNSRGFGRLLDKYHELKDAAKAEGLPRRFLRIDAATAKYTPFTAEDTRDTARCVQDVRHTYARGEVVLFVEYTNKKRFFSGEGSYPTSDVDEDGDTIFTGAGPEAVPEGAIATAMATAATIFDINIRCFERYLDLKSPVTYHQAVDGIRQLTRNWLSTTRTFQRDAAFQNGTWQLASQQNHPGLLQGKTQQLAFRAGIIRNQLELVGITPSPQFPVTE